MKLSEKIKLLRTSENLTQPELANKAGIEQSYLSKLENDKGSPSFEVISKIAQAFNLSGMQLINSLSQSYIENHLSHIPEVAAEFASVKQMQQQQIKRRFILASLTVVFGVGLYYMGIMASLFPEVEYIYESSGVIKEHETIFQFSHNPIREIQETQEEASQRIKSNRKRLSVIYLTLPEYAGITFIGPVDGGRRVYEFREEKELNSINNQLISTLGVMLIVAGIFMFVYSFKFRSI
ncbi:MAG: helix-turn-helix domain-containing protein [Marinicella sp.]